MPLGVAYALAIAQGWLWLSLTNLSPPKFLSAPPVLELTSLGLAVGWLAIFSIAIRRFGRWGCLALPSAPPALLPPMSIAALYAACYFENNCP